MTGKFSPADLNNAVTLYASGKTLGQVATETGISPTTIHRAVKARGIEPRQPYRTPAASLNYAVELYVSGKSGSAIHESCGVSPSVLSRELHKRGIKARTIRADLPAPEVASAYLQGESELAIARRFGVSRAAIRHVLTDQAIPVRGRGAAQVTRLAKMSEDERLRLLHAAHDSVRGRAVPAEERFQRARCREQTLSHASQREFEFAKYLRVESIEVTPQKAVGSYNVDFAVGPIAVEILGGNWHSYKPEHAQRTPYILDAGWHMLFIWDRKQAPLCIEAAEYVIAWAKQASGNPSAVRQYRVIRGDGKLVATGCADDQHFPLVPTSISNFSGRPIN